jgi:DNA invertase Pin-like site-specific DNA recombinase
VSLYLISVSTKPGKVQLHIEQFISVEMSSRKSTRERRIDELMNELTAGDVILVAELSRLGRNMFEVIEIINRLGQKEVEVVFVHQPELSTVGLHRKLLLAMNSYFAEAEREFISLRTKQGLAVARAKGKQLGRPRGSRDKHRVLDPYRSTIKEHLQMRVLLRRIQDIVNPQLTNPLSYTTYRYFVMQDPELLSLWKAHK